LLLADDSAAVQKVIELTFADEGMNVVSVGDGRSALEKLEHVRPDVVLADAFMPELDGYQLCRSIKDDQRFSQIPVMLLVSSFAPFDEAEARRAGADDIMTKPFQSIRQLVSRVGSLLGSNKPAAQVAVPESKSRSTPVQTGPNVSSAPVQTEPNVTVLVEAAQLATPESHEASGGACAPDIEFQTADTAHLDPVEDPSGTSEFDAQAFEDTIEVEPQYDHAMNAGSGHFTPVAAAVEYAHPTSMNEPLHTPEPARQSFNDALLDLDESDFGAAASADDDVILDLDDESPSASQSSFSQPSETPVIELPAAVRPEAEMAAPEPEVAETEAEVVAEATPFAVGSSSAVSQLSSGQLSPEVIDAIARRVIEHLSDRVVREIAWEVVPELSELLIKKKLEEQK
jgi:CheY-like chemotaxis protein